MFILRKEWKQNAGKMKRRERKWEEGKRRLGG